MIETHTELRRLPIAEWVVDLWERVRAKTSEMNVRIVARGSEVVGAHRLVLEEASYVLGAMLRSPTCEVWDDRSRVIRVDQKREAIEESVVHHPRSATRS